MSGPSAEPSTQALGESLAALAAQVADLRGQVAQVNQRLDRAGLRGDLDLVARFEELARSVADTLDAAAPRGPTAPFWLGLDREAYLAELAKLRNWTDTVLRQHYSGYELRDCWPCHIHAVWELSTLAAAWHHAYGGQRPDLARALEFYDRWLPGTMRRVAHITRACDPDCVTRAAAAPGDGPARTPARPRSPCSTGSPTTARLTRRRTATCHCLPGPAARPHHAPAGHRSQRSTPAGLSPGTITTATAADCPSHAEHLKIQTMTVRT